jgi:hypothetical protein
LWVMFGGTFSVLLSIPATNMDSKLPASHKSDYFANIYPFGISLVQVTSQKKMQIYICVGFLTRSMHTPFFQNQPKSQLAIFVSPNTAQPTQLRRCHYTKQEIHFNKLTNHQC